VVSASGVLGVGVSYLFRRGQEAWGSFCAGPRRPSWAVRGLAASRGVAVARRSTTTCCFASTQEQEPPPSNTGNEPPAASPRKESTLETDGRPLPPLSGRKSRVVPVAVGMDGRACREGHRALRLCRLPRVLWERAGAVFAWVASLFLGGVPSGRT